MLERSCTRIVAGRKDPRMELYTVGGCFLCQLNTALMQVPFCACRKI